MRRSIGDKVTVSKDDKELIIKIPGSIEKWMENALLSWVIVWSLIGLYVTFYMFAYDLSKDEQVFFAVYLAFWGYFEYKSVRAWMFKRFGFELIRLDGEFMYHKIDILGRGKLKRFMTENIKGLRVNDEEDKNFSYAYNKSFWILGNERIAFDYMGKKAVFGMHMDDKDAKEVVQLIRKRIKSRS